MYNILRNKFSVKLEPQVEQCSVQKKWKIRKMKIVQASNNYMMNETPSRQGYNTPSSTQKHLLPQQSIQIRTCNSNKNHGFKQHLTTPSVYYMKLGNLFNISSQQLLYINLQNNIRFNDQVAIIISRQPVGRKVKTANTNSGQGERESKRQKRWSINNIAKGLQQDMILKPIPIFRVNFDSFYQLFHNNQYNIKIPMNNGTADEGVFLKQAIVHLLQ